jgi:carbonic anhydrase
MLGDLRPIQFKYSAKGLEVLNNGHTIQVQRTSSGSIAVGGEEYELLQLHFHHPSEHTVQGEAYPMEMHLVHKSTDGELAVVGVFFREGAHNPHIEEIWESMPAQAAEETTAETQVNAADLLPEDRRYWHYAGSLTTPPCTEGVRWYVLKTPISVSREQVATFSSVMHDNARPVQPLYERGMISSK